MHAAELLFLQHLPVGILPHFFPPPLPPWFVNRDPFRSATMPRSRPPVAAGGQARAPNQANDPHFFHEIARMKTVVTLFVNHLRYAPQVSDLVLAVPKVSSAGSRQGERNNRMLSPLSLFLNPELFVSPPVLTLPVRMDHCED